MAMVRVLRTHRSGPRRGRAAMLGLMALAAATAGGLAFSKVVGPTRKQTRGNLHNKANLPPVLEVPLEMPEPASEVKEPEPERRVPYQLNVEVHCWGTNATTKYIEHKVASALDNAENLIKRVDVRVFYQENFHREKPGRGLRFGARPNLNDDGEVPAMSTPYLQEDGLGMEQITPFQFKVIVSLKNHRQLVLSNPEKHAQPTLTEAVDHMADVLRKMMREEKEKDVRVWRRRHRDEMTSRLDAPQDTADDEMIKVEETAEEVVSANDAAMERFYQTMEESLTENQDATLTAAQVVESAVKNADHGREVAEEKEEAHVQTSDLSDLLLGGI